LAKLRNMERAKKGVNRKKNFTQMLNRNPAADNVHLRPWCAWT